MTRLAGIGGPTAPPAAIRPPAPGTTPGFAVPDETRGSAAAVQRPGGLVALAGLLALQGAEMVPDARGREARRRGRAVLAALSSLQGALLGGGDPDAAATQLAAAISALPASADPGLHAILTAIKLRAMVELARREAEDGETKA